MVVIFPAIAAALNRLILVCFITTIGSAIARPIDGQEKCITPQRLSLLINEIKSPASGQLNEALRTEITSLKKETATEAATAYGEKQGRVSKPNLPKKSDSGPDKTAAERSARICQILNTSPWPGKSVVGEEAASDWMALIKAYVSVPQQRDLLPVISAGLNNGEIPKDSELAAFVDRLRLRVGQPQLFGTQLTEQDGFIVLYPLESEQNVDALRKEYGMEPLADHLRAIQIVYHKLVIRSTARVSRARVGGRSTPATTAQPELLNPETDNDVLRVNTSIVTVDATVTGRSVPKLEKADFKIYEDGQEQEITAFGTSESPFDIVLLLDLSGSTADKIGLIRRTTKHFIETKRDVDRLAIVTFNSDQTVVSQLEADKTKLFDSLSKIKGVGASRVWDSEKFAIDLLNSESPRGRRKAVVVMTDGIDNDLFFTPGVGSSMLFADLIEEVRNSQISIFPIYLSPSGPAKGDSEISENARRSMQLLADESGGTFYTTANLDSLNEVYERVLQDVGQVYSLGYQPKNDRHDGSWRTIRVEIPEHPDLKVRARTGYYAR